MNSGNNKADWLRQTAQTISSDQLDQLGPALVVAPHPDDESLGCGGTIARLRQRGQVVHVVFVSDGTMSHPNSPGYPANRLRQLRESEALEALRLLAVSAEQATFMRLKDRQVPTPGSPGFADAVALVQTILTQVGPATVFVPWRRDPHPDHRASWQILNSAIMSQQNPPRVLEYPIWLWELGQQPDMPTPGEVRVWRVPTMSVRKQRNEAIAAHRSQVTRLIDDDPTAFYLSPELLRYFDKPDELFLEATTEST